ncbi:MAG: phosphatase PAP2 family protein [Beijerinckiaceae bacterium]|nr:phosphatase PAP2 family protein [Beijerinckiaceae bacterium]MCZ8300601.1 phosphatase PAP2 family protein [Beijerinckiaceae bacterium]
MTGPKRNEPGIGPDRFAPLMVIALTLGLAIAFAVVAGITDPVDRVVARLFSEGNIGLEDPRLREALRDFTALGSFAVLGFAVFAASLFLLVAGLRSLAAIILVSSLSAAGVSTGLKHWLGRSRPDFAEPGIATFTASFPSGHAFLSMCVFVSIGGFLAMAARRRREKTVILGLALFLTLAIGASRVMLGVHWLTDVLAGWCFGLAWATGTIVVGHRIAKGRKAV